MDPQLKSIIDIDGYHLEKKVRLELEKNGWIVKPQEHYTDLVKKVDRTIDIIAEKVYERSYSNGWHIGVRLIIECKWRKTSKQNRPNDIAVNTEKRNIREIKEYIGEEFDLDNINHWDIENHRYLNENIHLSNNSTPNDGYLYEGIEQCVHAHHDFKSNQINHTVKTFQFPIVITDGPGKVFILETEKELPGRYQYFYPYKVENKRYPHIIDIVPYSEIKELLSDIDNDIVTYKRIEDFKSRRRVTNTNNRISFR